MVCHSFVLFCSCGEVVTKREQFNDLSIDLPRRKKTLPLRSIQDSLDLFFRVCPLHKRVIVHRTAIVLINSKEESLTTFPS